MKCGGSTDVELFMQLIVASNPVTRWSLRTALVNRLLRNAYAKSGNKNN